MSYRTIKGYIIRRMSALGYLESQEKFDFDGESDLNFDRSFIVESPQGAIQEGNTLGSTFYPERTMTVKIAWELSESSIADYDNIQEAIDFIIKDLHSPANWTADGIKNFQYDSYTVRPEKKYLLAEITFKATDSFSF